MNITYSKKTLLYLSVSISFVLSCTDTKLKNGVLFEPAEVHDIEISDCVDDTPGWECTNRLADEFCDLEFIPLENNSEEPLGEIYKMQACDSGLYIQDYQEASLYFYTYDGSFVSRICTKGHSKEEVTRILNWAANDAGDTVAVMDYNYVKFYDNKGTFLRADALSNTVQWQGFIYTDKGFFLSTSNRGLRTVLGRYTNDFKTEEPIIKAPVNLIRDNPSSWENLLQSDGKRICYYDYYTNTFYIFNKDNLSDCKAYILHSDNAVTESKVRDEGIDSEELERIETYVYEDNSIWGLIKYGDSYQGFRLNMDKNSCLINGHIDLGYSNFICAHDGWYYSVWIPSNIMEILDIKNGQFAQRELIWDAIEPYKDKIKDTDNYYILRMRKKEGF